MKVKQEGTLTELVDYYLPNDLADWLYTAIGKLAIFCFVGGGILGAVTTFLVMR